MLLVVEGDSWMRMGGDGVERDARHAVSSRCTVELEEEREREHMGGGETSVYVLFTTATPLHALLHARSTLAR